MNNSDVRVKPFLKWVGGKRSLLPILLDKIPKYFEAYHEPFLGGGALFYAINSPLSFISDINERLINTYKCVRDNLTELKFLLGIHSEQHCLEYYKEQRHLMSTEKNSVKLASIFIYLNKTAYNGVYRVNSKNIFNVPMGKYVKPNILDEKILESCSFKLQTAQISCSSFESNFAYKNHFYYLDPPYHKTYNLYDKSGFGEAEHKRLADFCELIDSERGYFMLSNSDTPFIRSLFKSFSVEVVEAPRYISCKGNQRKKENELLIRNYR